MSKRILWAVVFLLVSVTPTVAQQSIVDPVDLIPADFSGFVSLQISDETLIALDAARDTASIFQPQRVQATPIQSIFNFPIEEYDDFVPFGILADVDDASFVSDILPWIGSDFVMAFRDFGDGFAVQAEDMLFVIPAEKILLSAQSLGRITEQQASMEESTYRDVRLYEMDESTLAFTEEIVFIGASDAIRASLDILAGEESALTDDEIYQAVRQAAPDDAMAFAYLRGSKSLSALNFLLNGGDEDSEMLLESVGGAIARLREDDSLLEHLLSGSADGIGISLVPENRSNFRANLDAVITIHDANSTGNIDNGTANDALLELVPRNAMIVLSGGDVDGLARAVMATLPAVNFLGRALSEFTVQSSVVSQTGLLPLPTEDDIEQAITSSLAALENVGGYNLQEDLLDHLSGDYVFAALPRPNDPTPLFDTRADLLLMVQVDDADAALDGATQLVQLILDIQQLASESVEDDMFTVVTLAATGDPIVSLGVLDDVLVVATGTASEAVLEAHEGDDRLVDEMRWIELRGETNPDLYIDLAPFVNTFFPSPGGPGTAVADQLVTRTRYEANGIIQVDVTVRSEPFN